MELVSSEWNNIAAPGMGGVSEVVLQAFGQPTLAATNLYGNGDASEKIADRLTRL